ncbi:MAG: 2,3-bisphosphoglycerate-dependent phosphoglycerate mutase [Candidatus Daviesbacteria bacterium GW2011_GWA1_41_61]|uniref:2,3-bisphosphoglycerate-dependent phosphoglycerate mutase n=1 Tax=Candidatus Daviesbacteria bacterium GW2011_GWA2_40_9 TaxID=1618424 RepID=A0A0G0WEJ9_9BACT|nr:MAG: phosphoglycerate mutase 1 family, phosphoglycerate mutase [Candidatus Daviesbacteria bacterium GW2011_GWC1_40_9]KKR82700.1 MAG: 2,3-bisphosphoglycerate-dependent phosphoglycerate mutase [Candidatus Daviesbacteria bacterium GW2011_GWA2_40_9]KKR93344.1 MAG: 2,3-bisphosphoglycerate-dependent phosphoglycerate mutase [Candidatus Daviesbacteria bacterium GW2011_GWB1_41_15]KKS15107.1 MAG: 2,3-bisphosphoglycerate-dependent phosphoglycerate mutase [Candidatus Daviesbacteria bacterium GW2011_GWA1_
MPYLVLIRHGESKWNALEAWTGLTDISLDEKGRKVARKDGEFLGHLNFDRAYVSALRRAQQTLDEIKVVLGREDLETVKSAALNERDYGDLTGKNKWELKKKYGEEQFLKWRRSWNYPVPNGETLKDVYLRVYPYYKKHIFPDLKAGKNVLVVAHGNSLRALVKYLENIPDDKIPNLEISIGQIYLYQINSEGQVISKNILTPR